MYLNLDLSLTLDLNLGVNFCQSTGPGPGPGPGHVPEPGPENTCGEEHRLGGAARRPIGFPSVGILALAAPAQNDSFMTPLSGN